MTLPTWVVIFGCCVISLLVFVFGFALGQLSERQPRSEDVSTLDELDGRRHNGRSGL